MEQKHVPILHPLEIAIWAETNLNVMPNLCQCLHELVSYLPLEHARFEYLHVLWEQLQHILRNKTHMTLGQYYMRNGYFPQTQLVNANAIYGIRECHQIGPSAEEMADLQQYWNRSKVSPQDLVLLSNNNTGFNALLWLQDISSKVYIPVVFEIHFANTASSPAEMNNKFAKTKEHLELVLQPRSQKQFKINNNFITVFVDVSQEPSNAEKTRLPTNSIFINSAHWRRLLSPTLAACMDILPSSCLKELE